MRVLSLNLHTYQEDDALAKLREVADGAAAVGADLLLLQEVGEHISDPTRPNAGRVIAERLAAVTGSAWHHEWREAHIGFDTYHEGLSILSRLPMESAREHTLSGGALRRNAVSAVLMISSKRVLVATAHTTWPPAGDAEIALLIGELDRRASSEQIDAVILAGDLNAPSGSPQVSRLRDAGYTDAATATGAEAPTIGSPPSKRIDYQFHRAAAGTALRATRMRTVFDGGAIDGRVYPRVSDHVGLVADYIIE